MALPDLARAHYAVQQSLAERVVRAVLELWALIDPSRLSESWASQRLGERMFVTLAAAQLAAASSATEYVARAVAEQGGDSDPDGVLDPRSLAGVASDGRGLESLLFTPVVRTKQAISDGAETTRAVQMGGSSLATIADTQVSDAGRAAVDVAMIAEPTVTGWVRMLVPPSCGRCAILAGRRYRWSEGFQRHENCDCTMIPAVEDRADDLRTDPAAYFASLPRSEQDRLFGKANTQAILDGADMNRVVNAGRSTSVPGRSRSRGRRPTPAQIYADATDRDDAVRRLRRAGFITT